MVPNGIVNPLGARPSTDVSTIRAFCASATSATVTSTAKTRSNGIARDTMRSDSRLRTPAHQANR